MKKYKIIKRKNLKGYMLTSEGLAIIFDKAEERNDILKLWRDGQQIASLDPCKVEGLKATASIMEGRPWISYSNSNEGEPNHYRDYYTSNGHLAYYEGEQVEILELNNDVILRNQEDFIFTIPLNQFKSDFTILI